MGACCPSDNKLEQNTEVETGREAGRSEDQALVTIHPPSAHGRAFDQSVFIVDNPGKVSDFYECDKKKMGEGSFGSVCKAKQKATGAIRAIKTIAKSQVKDKASMEKFKQEIALMKIMDHANIIKLYETFQDKKNIDLVMELCTGGELFDRVVNEGSFDEKKAAHVMQQMFRAIFYMHENKICHRDIKPENFLLESQDAIDHPNNALKVIDFGLSCKFKEGQVLTTKAGTPYYVAPQCLQGKYNQACDLWSIGVVLYILLCGYPPFYADDDAGVLRKVRAGKFSYAPEEWDQISADAKDLVTNLLWMDPVARCNAEQALSHKWTKEQAPSASTIRLDVVSNLRKFQGQNMLKKAALHFIAGQLDTKQIRQLRETFEALDDNGNGQLTVAEMRDGISRMGLTEIPDDLTQLMNSMDTDGSGVIDYTEFLAASLDKKMYLQRDVCWQAFSLFDRDGSGTISKEELRLVLGESEVEGSLGSKAVADLLLDIDCNGDGMIDFDEFMTMMKDKA